MSTQRPIHGLVRQLPRFSKRGGGDSKASERCLAKGVLEERSREAI